MPKLNGNFGAIGNVVPLHVAFLIPMAFSGQAVA